jgi:hypothetical protein
MTIVAVVVVVNTRQKKPFHYTPTVMSAVPTTDLTMNPHQQALSTRAVLSFPPTTIRQAQPPPPPFE